MVCVIPASGGSHQTLFAKEVTCGVTPITSFKYFLPTDTTLGLTRDSFESAILRGNQQIQDLRSGVKQIKGDLGAEFIPYYYDDLLEAAMGGQFRPAVGYVNNLALTGGTNTALTSITIVRLTGANAGKTTIASPLTPFVTAGIVVGDYINISTPLNSGVFYVTAVANNLITVNDPTLLLVAEGPVAGDLYTQRGASQVQVDATKWDYLYQPSFSIERGFNDVGQYQLMSGCHIGTFKMSVQPNAIVTTSFGVVGIDQIDATGVANSKGTINGIDKLGVDYTGSLFSPMDGIRGGSILVGAANATGVGLVAAATITGMDISIDRSLSPVFVIGSDKASGIVPGRNRITGTVTAFFNDFTMYDRFLNETKTAIKFSIATGDPAVDSHNRVYDFYLPNVVFSSADVPVSGEGAITMTMNFTATFSPTAGVVGAGGTTMIVTRT